MEFNLIIERWIPVLLANGRAERVGIRTALLQAGRIRQIAASNPMDNVALLRFLLAVLMWCRPGLDEADRRLLDGAGGIPEEWLGNLGTAQQANPVFNLLGDPARFVQAPATANNPRPVADLFHELPGATNVAHLRHITDFREGACPACIAIGLVRLPVAMTGKGSGKRPGINGDPPLYFVPVGRTLIETLRLNLPLAVISGDTPCWVPDHKPADKRVGVMEGFTWTSRQFRIADDGLRAGTCLLCGAVTPSLVTRLLELNKPNGRDDLSRADAKRWRDPHLVHDDKGKAFRAADCEKNMPGGAGQWRAWHRCLIESEADAVPPLVIGTAIATRQNDKSVESISFSIRAQASVDASSALMQLDEAVRRLLDPSVTRKGDGLSRFKCGHPLRFMRRRRPETDPPLPDSVRAALADRLPALEHAMQRTVEVAAGTGCTTRQIAASTGWRQFVETVARSTTPGSPLRRREAEECARKTLESVLRGAAARSRGAAEDQESAKPKRTRTKKGTAS